MLPIFMADSMAHLLEEVLALPTESRLELAEHIWDNTPPHPDLIQEQLKEVERRMASVKEGRSQLIAADEAHRQVREAF